MGFHNLPEVLEPEKFQFRKGRRLHQFWYKLRLNKSARYIDYMGIGCFYPYPFRRKLQVDWELNDEFSMKSCCSQYNFSVNEALKPNLRVAIVGYWPLGHTA